MAIDVEIARLLLQATKRGVVFTETLMLGRQNFTPTEVETRRLMAEFGFDVDQRAVLDGIRAEPRYAEAFLGVLGAREPQSMDATAYEHASLVHDLNQPIPSELGGRFDVVLDGGTLEHVFNFQTALLNAMRMVKVGGRLILNAPANNYFGHGFYQFSPELFFRVLNQENGFQMERMVAIEYGPRRRWYEVLDPDLIRDRTPLVNSYMVLLYVQARKVSDGPARLHTPQQSDYRALWKANAAAPAPMPVPVKPTASSNRHLDWAKSLAPDLLRGVEALYRSSLNRRFSFRNRKAFRPLDKHSQ